MSILACCSATAVTAECNLDAVRILAEIVLCQLRLQDGCGFKALINLSKLLLGLTAAANCAAVIPAFSIHIQARHLPNLKLMSNDSCCY
jgi:hypothetical protein